MSSPGPVSYVLPLRCGVGHTSHGELATYLATLVRWAEVLVVDGSEACEFEAHGAAFSASVRHLPIDPDLAVLNGKAAGVITGVHAASCELVVIADDDVRYGVRQLRAVASRLEGADLVVPQNAFPLGGMPWHTRWDTARSLLNRSLGTDHPGTLAVRRSTFVAMGGYDGDVLFENLELVRTVRAWGGRVHLAPDLIITRRAPTTATFFHQRVRQAYDDFAQPGKQAMMLAGGPLVAWAAIRRRYPAITLTAAMLIALAELGRWRGGGRRAFPASASLLAPAWFGERLICSWIALATRIVRGGCPYVGHVIPRAATPMSELRRRARRHAQSSPGGPGALSPDLLHAFRRREASSEISRNDTRRSPRAGAPALDRRRP